MVGQNFSNILQIRTLDTQKNTFTHTYNCFKHARGHDKRDVDRFLAP